MNIDLLLKSMMLSDTNSLGLYDILFSMLIPFLLSFIVTYIYKLTHSYSNYSVNFIQTIFLFATLSSVVTLLIGSNIARAFGLIGALSIVRFRNAVKEPLDAVYIFWALAIGMACGTQFYFAAVVLVVICAIIMLFLHYSNYGKSKYTDSLLKVMIKNNTSPAEIKKIEKIIKNNTINLERVNIYFDSEQDDKTYVYSLRTKLNHDNKEMLQSLSSSSNINKVHHLNRDTSLFVNS